MRRISMGRLALAVLALSGVAAAGPGKNDTRTVAGVLRVVVSDALTSRGAEAAEPSAAPIPRPAPDPQTQAPPEAVRTEAARLYLAQSLASLAQARQSALRVQDLGGLEGFDLTKYLDELDRVAAGLQRYLAPAGPPPGAAAPVEITGQYLLEGLRRGVGAPRGARPGR